jgi:hypothetical protein
MFDVGVGALVGGIGVKLSSFSLSFVAGYLRGFSEGLEGVGIGVSIILRGVARLLFVVHEGLSVAPSSFSSSSPFLALKGSSMPDRCRIVAVDRITGRESMRNEELVTRVARSIQAFISTLRNLEDGRISESSAGWTR